MGQDDTGARHLQHHLNQHVMWVLNTFKNLALQHLCLYSEVLEHCQPLKCLVRQKEASLAC